MARSFVSANGQYMSYVFSSASVSPVSALPLTLAVWFRQTTQVSARLLEISNGTTALGVAINTTGTGSVSARSVASSVANQSTSSTLVTNRAWTHVAGVFTSSSRTVYQNGIAGTANNSSSNPSLMTNVTLGARYDGALPTNGQIAYPAVWNVALTAAELLQLASGASPLTVRPQNLVLFYPLNTPGINEVGGNYRTGEVHVLAGRGTTGYPTWAVDPTLRTGIRRSIPTPNTDPTTARFSAVSSSKLWRNAVDGGNHTGTPVDGDTVCVWQDRLTPTASTLTFSGTQGATASQPSWKSPGAMSAASLYFDGGDTFRLINNAQSANQPLSTLFSASTKTAIFAIRLTADGTNLTNPYDNTAVFSDSSGYFGLHVKTSGGTHTLVAYNWDGSSKSCSVTVSLNTDYVVMIRQNATTLYLSVLSGSSGGTRADASVATGNTSVLTGTPQLMKNYNSQQYATGYMGEMWFAAADLGATNTYLSEIVATWLPASTATNTNMLLMF